MRRVKMKFIIPESDEANAVGKLFKVYLELRQIGDNFVISEKRLNLKITFEGTPENLISVISEIPFQYVEYLTVEEMEENSNSSLEETTEHAIKEDEALRLSPKQDEKTAVPEKSVEEESEPVSKQSAKKKSYLRKLEEADENGIKVFKEQAEKSGSFEEFVENFGRFLKINQYHQNFYLALVKTACNIENITVSAISENIEKYGEPFSDSKRIVISEKIKKAFSEVGSNVRFMSFLKEIAKYKNYVFLENQDKQPDAEKNISNEESHEPEFKVISKELLDKIESQGAIDFSSKVGVIFDEIKSDRNEAFYTENRGKIISVVVTAAEEYSRGNRVFFPTLSKSEELFGEKFHLAKALILQSIMDYVDFRSAGMYNGYGAIDLFFEDLIKLM